MESKLENLLISLYAISLALLIFNISTKEVKKYYKPTSPLSNNISAFANKYPEKKKVIFGFLPYWKLNKIDLIKTQDISDIAYFGLQINSDGHIKKYQDAYSTDPGHNNWRNSKELDNLIAAKTDVRYSLTILSHDDAVTDAFLDCSSCWVNLKNDLIEELDYRGIKNVNFDFEYVEFPTEDKATKYSELIKYINTALDKEYGDSFVTVSAFADSLVKQRITNIEQLAKIADAIFIMAYDFHYPFSTKAGPVSPINGGGTNFSYDINTMLNDYLTVSPPNKLILGVGYYGYNWIVEDYNKYANRIEGNDTIGYSISQSYEDIINTILEVRPNIMWDEIGQVPYFHYISPNTSSLRLVFYENPESLKIKYDIVNSKNLLGIGIWALGYDGGYQELWQVLENSFIEL